MSTARHAGEVPSADGPRSPRQPLRERCPRCGAALGALAASREEAPAELYCGCCGLVVPAPVSQP